MTDLGPMSDGDIIDAEIVDEPFGAQDEKDGEDKPRAKSGRAGKSDPTTSPPRSAKAGPPSLDEWVNFFSRVVLRLVTEYYLNYAFRGIDEDALTEREVDRLALSDEERQMIVVPFAELSHKSKIMRRHGRTIVASGDAFNAVVVFGAWVSRVNRIAAKYRPKEPRSRTVINGSSGQGTTASETEGSAGGHFPPWFSGPVVPGPS